MTRIGTIIVLIIICIFVNITSVRGAVKVDSELRKKQDKTYFAINGGKAFHIPNDLNTTVKKRVEWMKELGITWDRSDWWWHIIEPQKGKYDFTIPDKILKFYEDNGIQIYPILCYGAAWWNGRSAPINDQEIDEYADYVYKTVSRYKDHFTYWSIWNEPNIQTFWNPNPDAAMYAKLLKKAYIAAKKADPDCKICAPIIAPQGEWDMKYVERLYQLGCKDYFDVFDYHYYRNTPPEQAVPLEIAEIKALMHRYGDDHKPIWISETGISSPITQKPQSYETQASLIVRNHLLAYANGVERIFYFDLQNWMDDSSQPWDGCLGLIQANDEKKPSFSAYQTMVKELEGKRVIGEYKGFGKYTKSILIYDSKHDLYSMVVWNQEAGKEKDVDFYGGFRRIIDRKGNGILTPSIELVTYENDKEVLLNYTTISDSPIYVELIDKERYLPDAGIKFSNTLLEMAPGDKQSLTIQIDSLLSNAKIKVVKITADDGLSWDEKKGILSVAEDISNGKKNIKIFIEITNKDGMVTYLERKVEINIIPSFSLTLRPYLENTTLWYESVLNNFSSHTVKEKYKVDAGFSSAMIFGREYGPYQLNPGESTTLRFTPNWKWTNIREDYQGWQASFGEYRSKSYLICPIKFSTTPPVVDGDFSEWSHMARINLDREGQITRGKEGWTPHNAAAIAQFWFTQDTIYFAAEIYDNDPMFNNFKPVDLWRGDCFELYLGFCGPTKRTSLDKSCEFQIAIAPNSIENRPMVFQWHVDKEIKGAQIISKKTDYGYIIETGIPIKALGDFKIVDGMLIGLDVALDDLDKDDWAPQDVAPGRALMWNGNNMNWINPSGWGMGIIQKSSN